MQVWLTLGKQGCLVSTLLTVCTSSQHRYNTGLIRLVMHVCNNVKRRATEFIMLMMICSHESRQRFNMRANQAKDLFRVYLRQVTSEPNIAKERSFTLQEVLTLLCSWCLRLYTFVSLYTKKASVSLFSFSKTGRT